MGRALKGGTTGRPRGREWQAFRRKMIARWGNSPPCYYCLHPCGNSLELAHLIPPAVAPWLTMVPENVRPSHGGGGEKRCQTCGIACNAVAAGNLAPRGEGGKSLPFPAAFVESHRRPVGQAPAPRLAAKPRPAAKPAPALYPDAGRDW